jgi:hypothetical protein
VRVKSNPGLYLSLGSPFAGGEGGMSLSEYLSVDGLKKQLGGESQNIDILEWDSDPDSNVQAYRVRYPVADINIDLSEYVESMDVASNLPTAQSGWIPSTTGSEIEIPLPLDSMSFAHDVTNVKISVTLKFAETTGTTPPDENQTGETTVPDGVTVTFKGDVFGNTESTQTDNKWTSPNIATFQPATDKISIAVTVPAATVPSVRWFSPELGFEWEKADIEPEGGTTLSGKYPLDFSNFGSFMGDGVSFSDVSGYMYLKNDLNQTSPTLKLKWNKTGEVEEEVDIGQKTIEGVVENWTNENFSPSDDTNKKIDLNKLFTHSLTFEYELTLNKVTVQKTESKTGLLADMVILLPLEFKLTESSSIFKDDSGKAYGKLNLEALNMSSGNNDLLGRTSGNDQDSMFKNMQDAKILISGYRNDMIDGLAFGVVKKEDSTQLIKESDLGTGSASIDLTVTDLEYPFNPKFELLVPSGDVLTIKKKQDGKDPTIDFTIAVEATTDLDYQVKF